LAYIKTVWSTGDTITATLANHLETQYDEAKVDLDAHKAEQAPHAGHMDVDGSKAMTGPLDFVDANVYVKRLGNEIHTGSKSASALLEAKQGSYITQNAYSDSTQWLRIDTTLPAYAIAITGGKPQLYYAAAGANPITWTMYDIHHKGNFDPASKVNTQYNSSLNTDSRNSRGVTRLYRRDGDNDYSLQHHYGLIFTGGNAWQLKGYAGDTFHAEAHVAFATKADTVDGIHFRISGGALQYDDGSGWKDVGQQYTRPQTTDFYSTTTANTWYTALDVLGKTNLTRISLWGQNADNAYYEVRITIDGIAHTRTVQFSQSRGIGGGTQNRYNFCDILLNVESISSMKVEIRQTLNTISTAASIDWARD
jgi:hypothetical protein